MLPLESVMNIIQQSFVFFISFTSLSGAYVQRKVLAFNSVLLYTCQTHSMPLTLIHTLYNSCYIVIDLYMCTMTLNMYIAIKQILTKGVHQRLSCYCDYIFYLPLRFCLTNVIKLLPLTSR